MAEAHEQVPPASEEVHLPEPTYIPAIVALGITIAIVGVLLSWVVFGMGIAIALPAIVIWVRDTRRDISRLPLDH